MREIDRWSGGASALRRFTYRVVELDTGTELQVKPLDAPDDDFATVERGHRVAQEVTRLLLEETKVLQLWRATR